jgi:dimethylamine corrinoid protein
MSGSGMESLIAALLEGDCEKSLSQAQRLRQDGVDAEGIVVDGVEAAMATLDAKCTLEQFNLLELMLAGRAVMEVMKFLYPAGTAAAGSKGTVVVASLEGDVHDLGKNIFKMVLMANDYRVVDGGKDCPLRQLVEMVEKQRPLAVGISGLITSIIPQVRQVKELLRLRRLDQVRIIGGGAALKQSSADRLNVDFVAESAFDGLHYLDGLTGSRP